MALCLTCNTHFHGDEQFCPRDGTPLQTAPVGDRLVGRVLSGRYRLIDLLGQGGMGSVYRAHHILMDKPVAVKVLRNELASDGEAVARFHREARSASKLDHEHIIRVTDFGQSDDGLLFLVMELLDGESLAEGVRRGPLPWRRAASIMHDIALGLAHAHEQGIIHRDMKPENIVLVRRPKSNRQLVKVLDFGLAKLMHEAGPGVSGQGGSVRKPLTRTGVVFGTPEYMSPEQAEGLALDQRTDIYGLGALCYQMVTGEVPFSAATFLALITKTVQEIPVPPSRRLPGVELPAELEALILRCLEKAPQARPQGADVVAEELEQICQAYPDPDRHEARVRDSHPGERERAPSGPPVRLDTPRRQTLLGPAAKAELVHEAAGVAVTAPSPESHPDALKTPALADAYAATQGVPLLTPVPVPAVSVEAPPAPAAHAGPPAGASGPFDLRVEELSATEEAGSAELAREDVVSPPRRRGRGLIVAGGLVLVALAVAAGTELVLPRLLSAPVTPSTSVQPAERDPLMAAQELLSGRKVDEALSVLLRERQHRNTPALQRLLALAYEAKDNRLRALGHMHLAVSLSAGSAESASSRLALAQLLSRMGHPHEACRTATELLGSHPEQSLRQPAEALIRALRCQKKS